MAQYRCFAQHAARSRVRVRQVENGKLVLHAATRTKILQRDNAVSLDTTSGLRFTFERGLEPGYLTLLPFPARGRLGGGPAFPPLLIMARGLSNVDGAVTGWLLGGYWAVTGWLHNRGRRPPWFV